jgi:hypothetical protein
MRCADCKAWEIRLDDKDFGYCKANAPSPTVLKIEDGAEYQLVWPSTGKDDFCQQFQS